MQINIKNICDSVKNWIITNANNVGNNYNNLPAPFKNGYTYTYVLYQIARQYSNDNIVTVMCRKCALFIHCIFTRDMVSYIIDIYAL